VVSKISFFFKKLGHGQSPEKRRKYHLPSFVLHFIVWNTLPLKMGPTGCPNMLVRNYHFMLRNIPEEQKSPLMIW